MGKRKRNGTRTGYSEYRDGQTGRPVTLPKVFKAPNVFKGAVRGAVIEIVGEYLDNWWRSPFQREGETVAGLRSALCQKGHDFSLSEREAFALVGEALRKNGARRPTWEEGQPEYVVPDECCARCSGPIPERGRIGLRKHVFCSLACARSLYRDYQPGERDDRLREKAYRMLASARAEARKCKHCCEMFQPINPSGANIYCSRVCLARASRTVVERICIGCEKGFRPAQKDDPSVYCSRDCRAGFKTARFTIACEWCGDSFEAKVRSAKYCSSSHRNKASLAARAARAVPEVKILPPVSNVIYLTAELFDKMFYRPRRPPQEETASEALDRLFAEAG